MMDMLIENKVALDCFMDIETMPTEDPAMIAEIATTVTVPRTYKKADSIAAWEKDEKPQLVSEAVSKTALDGTYGRVCAIGWAIDDAPAEVWLGDERDVIGGFFDAVHRVEKVRLIRDGEPYDRELRWIGHNVRSFDLRFLWQRAVIHKLRMPPTLRIALNARPFGPSTVVDTMTLWNPERDHRVSLDRLCKALGIPSPKVDMDGTQVCAAMRAGEIERVRAYVQGDIAAVRACYYRMMIPQQRMLA